MYRLNLPIKKHSGFCSHWPTWQVLFSFDACNLCCLFLSQPWQTLVFLDEFHFAKLRLKCLRWFSQLVKRDQLLIDQRSWFFLLRFLKSSGVHSCYWLSESFMCKTKKILFLYSVWKIKQARSCFFLHFLNWVSHFSIYLASDHFWISFIWTFKIRN